MRVSINIMTWDCLENTIILFDSLISELLSLKSEHDIDSEVFIFDSGSKPDMISYLENDVPKNWNIKFNGKNDGICIGRNYMIEQSLKTDCKYLFMFDNDVKIIKNSLYEMIRYMEDRSNNKICCLAQNINCYTKDIDNEIIPKEMPPYKEWPISINMKNGLGGRRAWTHYVVYDIDLFKNGLRFEIEGPFGKAGYSFSDDHLGMQILKMDKDIVIFDIYCYHNLSSSISLLRNTINWNENEKERFDHYTTKWKEELNL